MKKWNIFILAVFAIPILIMGVWSLTDTDATVSASENRTLATAPQLNAETWFGGEWFRSFGTYYADTFPVRDTLLSAETAMNSFYLYSPFKGDEGGVALLMPGVGDANLAEGGESIFDIPGAADAALGDDGSAAVTPPAAASGSPEHSSTAAPDAPPEAEHQPTASPSETPPDLPDNEVEAQTGIVLISGGHAVEIVTRNNAALDSYAEAINAYATAMPTANIYSLIAPNSAAFNAPSDYRTGSHDQQALISHVYDQLVDVTGVDAYSEMRLHTDEYLYFRSDHHWTQLGAYYAYRAFCTSAGLTPFELDAFETGQIDGFVGSLYTYTKQNPASKVLSDNPDTVYTWRPVRDFTTRIYPNLSMSTANSYGGYVISNIVQVSNKYLAFISGDNPLMVIETDVDNGRSVVVIKESFGNAFVPFLVNHYSKVYVVDPRKYNGSNKPDGDLAAFVKEHAIDDVIVINYPLAANNPSFIKILSNMVN